MASRQRRRPALLAPTLGCVRILRTPLKFDAVHPHLHELARAVVEFADGRYPLDLSSVKRTQDKATWEQERAQVLAQVKIWIQNAPHKTLMFQAATLIWQRWVKEATGPIHQLLAPILDPKFGTHTSVERNKITAAVGLWATRLTDETWIRGQVDLYDTRASKRSTIKIAGPPFDRIVGYCNEAVGYAKRWLDLELARLRTDTEGFRVQQVGKSRGRPPPARPTRKSKGCSAFGRIWRRTGRPAPPNSACCSTGSASPW